MTSSSPLFYVLHDVNANTYSRTLIPNDNIQNLHTLFEVRPRWFNRTKTACDRIGVTMISFKDATPHTEMVSLRHANKRVRRAVKCIDEDFLKSLSGGGKRKKKKCFSELQYHQYHGKRSPCGSRSREIRKNSV